MKKANRVAIGLRAKTARAIVVVLGGPKDSPVVISKFEIPLADAKVPATFQPYHAVMELPWTESQQAVKKSVRAIEAIARKELARLIKELAGDGLTTRAVGV